MQGIGKLTFYVLFAEATALRYGLCLAETIGCNKVIVNSNNLEAVSVVVLSLTVK